MNNLLLLLIIFLVFPTIVKADTYKYIDKNGVVTFTSDIKDVPKEYRDKVEIIKEEKEPQRDISPVKRYSSSLISQKVSENVTEKEQVSLLTKIENMPLESELIIFIFLITLFLFAHKIFFFIDNRRVITILKFSIILIMVIILFTKFANRQVDSYLETKKDIDKLKKTIETKDVKIDNLTK